MNGARSLRCAGSSFTTADSAWLRGPWPATLAALPHALFDDGRLPDADPSGRQPDQEVYERVR